MSTAKIYINEKIDFRRYKSCDHEILPVLLNVYVNVKLKRKCHEGETILARTIIQIL